MKEYFSGRSWIDETIRY